MELELRPVPRYRAVDQGQSELMGYKYYTPDLVLSFHKTYLTRPYWIVRVENDCCADYLLTAGTRQFSLLHESRSCWTSRGRDDLRSWLEVTVEDHYATDPLTSFLLAEQWHHAILRGQGLVEELQKSGRPTYSKAAAIFS